MKLLINGISLPYTAAEGDFIAEAKKRLGRVTDASAFDLKIFKKAVDARRRGDIRFVCSVLAEGEDGLISPDAAARALQAIYSAKKDLTANGNLKLILAVLAADLCKA